MNTLSRRTAPTSRIAAENSERFAGGHCERILAALRRRDGMTAGEIGQMTGLTNVQVCRRMYQLKGEAEPGADRACRVLGTKQQTWWLVVETAEVQKELF